MKRGMLVAAVVMWAGCGADLPVAADAMVSSSNLDVAIGAACDPQQLLWCASYTGVCTAAVCRSQCSVVDYPRCPAGEQEQPAELEGNPGCVCVPQ
jgi:hypothetical protein